MRCLYLLLIIIMATAVVADKPADINVLNKQCFNDGAFNFTIKDFYHKKFQLENLQVSLIDPNDNIIQAKGNWDKEYVKGDSCWADNPISFATYDGEIAQANLSGDYKLKLNYKNCEKTPCETCEDIVKFDQCQGYDYNCDLVDPNIRCFNKEGAVHILFNGINKNQFTKINPDNEILFELEGLETNWRKFSLSLTAENLNRTVKDYNNDSYYLVIPLENGRIAEKITLRLQPCNTYPALKFPQKCEYNKAEKVDKVVETKQPKPSLSNPLLTRNLAEDIIAQDITKPTEKTDNNQLSRQIIVILLALVVGFSLGTFFKPKRKKSRR